MLLLLMLMLLLFLFSLEKQAKRNEELRRADTVVLTYACNDPQSFSRLGSYWIEELRRLKVGGLWFNVFCWPFLYRGMLLLRHSFQDTFYY